MSAYYSARGGLPPQTSLMTGRAVFTESYCLIPRGVFSDIVTSYLPGWTGTRLWVIARPMTGFSETFSQYLMAVDRGGGSDAPEPDPGVECVIFVTDGEIQLMFDSRKHELGPGGYAYLPAGCAWRLYNCSDPTAQFHWVRKQYEPAPGIRPPSAFVTNEKDIAPTPMPETDGRWATTRFIDADDLSHDMHVNIATLQPGAVIPFEETHVMEHGIYVLEGKAVYKLNRDWVEVEAGDFIWLRAFCPQACYASGPRPFRYLLYRDVNRHAKLSGPGAFGTFRGR